MIFIIIFWLASFLAASGARSIALETVKLPEAKRRFVWTVRCRTLTGVSQRLPKTLTGLHRIAFVILMTQWIEDLAAANNTL